MRLCVGRFVAAVVLLGLSCGPSRVAAEPSPASATTDTATSVAASEPARVRYPGDGRHLPRLAGTLVMSDHKAATLVPDGTNDGAWIVAEEGEWVGGFLISKISPGQVVLRGPESAVTLTAGRVVDRKESVQPSRAPVSPESWTRTPGTRGFR